MLTEHTRSFTHNIRLHYIYYVYIHGYAIMRIRSLKRTLFYLYFLFTYTSFIFHTETHIVIHVCTYSWMCKHANSHVHIRVHLNIFKDMRNCIQCIFEYIFNMRIRMFTQTHVDLHIHFSYSHTHFLFHTETHFVIHTHVIQMQRQRVEGKI